jgi:hypothetical protein
MHRKIAAAVLLVFVSLTPARADMDPNTPVNATLQEQFLCPAKNCTTQCVGPGGPQTITNYGNLSAYVITQPDRLWLNLDNVTMIVLGVGDRCTFAGTPLKMVPAAGGSSSLPPVTPPCMCIGNQCNPPGCGPHVSPLK